MTRPTSVEAYQEIIANGTYSRTMKYVLRCLSEYGPQNQSMVHQKLIEKCSTWNIPPGMRKYSISPRFAVLERMGMIEQDSVAKCPMTGNKTVFWRLSGRKKPVISAREATESLRKTTQLKKLTETVKRLERTVLELKQKADMFANGQTFWT